MKYGLLLNSGTENFGDEIQSYATAQFLPRVDVAITRETIDNFKYEDGNEPVALIMAAWFMWRKWNWPPSKQIYPLVVGYHHYNRVDNVFKSTKYAIPMYNEHYNGIGGDWMKAYCPIGCRDEYTVDVLNESGIPNYFSGCITLTLPKQPKRKDAGKYVCLVDLNSKVEAKVRKLIGNKYEIRKYTHTCNYKEQQNLTWDERAKIVKERLTIYQNAKYVVTRRLHVALPCLAIGIPVLVISCKTMNDMNRWEPYYKWVKFHWNNDFLIKGTNFDFKNGTSNPNIYKKYRNDLIKKCKDYVSYCEKNKNKKVDFFNKTNYTDLEKLIWQNQLMKDLFSKVLREGKKMKLVLDSHEKKSILFIALSRIYKKHFYNKKWANKIAKKIYKKIK